MDYSTSPVSAPISSDPALIEDWSTGSSPISLPFSSDTDELDAQRIVHEDSIRAKVKDGQVIQHRSWKIGEVFRSDEDYLQQSPLQFRKLEYRSLEYPSSPTSMNMPATTSSPVAYPPSSSPPIAKRALSTFAPRKTKLDVAETVNGVNIGDELENASKRRRLSGGDAIASSPPAVSAQRGAPAKKPRAMGAFVDVDSDEEDSRPSFVLPSLSLDPANSMGKPAAMALDAPRPASFLFERFLDRREIRTCSGKSITIRQKTRSAPISFEKMIAARSTEKIGRAKKSYYGIDIHQLVSEGEKELKRKEAEAFKQPLQSIEKPITTKTRRTLMWTEKYRAKRFFDLVGDDRTHREVLRWLKGWDPIVFPGSSRSKPVFAKGPTAEGEVQEKTHRKILLLTGPPGLGKTTLAHVCAAQAGYEVMEINASDERSSNVVRGRIRTSVGTESVKNVGTTKKDGKTKKVARPVCVVVDEVDGVVGGSGGSGEGGFVKALIDLIQLDAKNASEAGTGANGTGKKKKGDNFRLLRPLILICNDVYHPSLRPLRQSSHAEVIHIRKPPLEAVVNRMKFVFDNEGISADNDGVRKLCEATWGMGSGPEAKIGASGTGEGDIRSILVVGEWVAQKLRSSTDAKPRLTKKWVEQHMLGNLSHGGDGTRGVGRGGAKELVSRVFLTGAGFPKPAIGPVEIKPKATSAVDATLAPKTTLHANEIAKRSGMDRLREMIDTSGETDRIVTDIFSAYPFQSFNDDSILSKPDAAYEWLYFHDNCSTRVYSEQSWELMPYLSQPVLACHNLFAAPARHYHSFEQGGKKWDNDGDTEEEEKEIPFSGPRADYDAREAEKATNASLVQLQGNFSAHLLRSFRNSHDIATDLLPYLVRMVAPNVKPVVVGGSGDQRGIASVRKEGEREMVRRAVDVMSGFDIKFEKGKVEGERGTQWVYRMDPPLDELTHLATTPENKSSAGNAPTRYAVMQVLSQEYQKNIIIRENAARQARFKAGNPDDAAEDVYIFSSADKIIAKNKSRLPQDGGVTMTKVKKDFFGRVLKDVDGNEKRGGGDEAEGRRIGREEKQGKKVWVTFHEGFSNAVRKPVSVDEIMRGL